MSKDETKNTRPSWHLKEIGSRLVVYAIERFGGDFYEKLGDALNLNEADLEKIMDEVTSYHERASLRCPHLDGKGMGDFAEALGDATFADWSASAKLVRSKKG
jgi:hypothetical protein